MHRHSVLSIFAPVSSRLYQYLYFCTSKASKLSTHTMLQLRQSVLKDFCTCQHTPAYASIRQHAAAYGRYAATPPFCPQAVSHVLPLACVTDLPQAQTQTHTETDKETDTRIQTQTRHTQRNTHTHTHTATHIATHTHTHTHTNTN
jgi:hypothetical protein